MSLNKQCFAVIVADKSSSFFTGSQAFLIGNIKAHASNHKHDLNIHPYISLPHLLAQFSIVNISKFKNTNLKG